MVGVFSWHASVAPKSRPCWKLGLLYQRQIVDLCMVDQCVPNFRKVNVNNRNPANATRKAIPFRGLS